MLIVLDNSSSVPLYQQISDQIRAKILSGELKPEDPLPSIRQLAADLLTSVITTKRAYQELEAEGLIQTRPGRGTYVTIPKGSSIEEMGRKEIEEQLGEVVKNARRLGITTRQLREIFAKVIELEVEQ